MSKEEDQSDIGSTKDVMYDAQLDPSTPQLFALPGENQDALEDRLFELENFLDMMDNGSPAVIDPNIFMAIVGHSAERSNASISENPICSMEYSLKNTPEEASSLVNAASSLLGLTTNHEASIDMRYELSRKRSFVQHGSEEDKRAKTVSSTTTGIISNESHSFGTYPVGKSLDANTISNSKQQGSLKPDCNIGPRKGSRATTPLKQTSQESNHMSCVPLQAYQSMKLRDSKQNVTALPLPESGNFPQYFGMRVQNGTRNCIMCGKSRIVVKTLKEMNGRAPAIPKKNGNVCTDCDKIVWVMVESGLQIKFCFRCRQFCPCTDFQNKGGKISTKCCNCLSNQREYNARYRLNQKKRRDNY